MIKDSEKTPGKFHRKILSFRYYFKLKFLTIPHKTTRRSLRYRYDLPLHLLFLAFVTPPHVTDSMRVIAMNHVVYLGECAVIIYNPTRQQLLPKSRQAVCMVECRPAWLLTAAHFKSHTMEKLKTCLHPT